MYCQFAPGLPSIRREALQELGFKNANFSRLPTPHLFLKTVFYGEIVLEHRNSFFLFGRGPHPAVFRAYSCLCTQGSQGPGAVCGLDIGCVQATLYYLSCPWKNHPKNPPNATSMTLWRNCILVLLGWRIRRQHIFFPQIKIAVWNPFILLFLCIGNPY